MIHEVHEKSFLEHKGYSQKFWATEQVPNIRLEQDDPINTTELNATTFKTDKLFYCDMPLYQRA